MDNVKENFNKAIYRVGAVVETPRTGYQNLKQITNLHPTIKENRIKETLEIVGLQKKAEDKVNNY